MLVVKQVLGDNTENVNATAVQNGRRSTSQRLVGVVDRLAPNRYTVVTLILKAFCCELLRWDPQSER